MQPHDPLHSALLERIVVGDVAATAVEARELLDACAVCRDRWIELQRLQAALSAAGVEEREGVAQAAAGKLAAGSERRIADWIGARSRSSRSGARRTRLFALALAASICGLILYRWIGPHGAEPAPRVPSDVYLDGNRGELRAVAPQGNKASYASFEWLSPPLAPSETFRLRITNLDADDSDPLVIGNIEGTSWRPDSAGIAESPRVEAFFAAAPRHIEWTVEICKSDGHATSISAPARASRD